MGAERNDRQRICSPVSPRPDIGRLIHPDLQLQPEQLIFQPFPRGQLSRRKRGPVQPSGGFIEAKPG
ncbi:hypothetical protein D3C81_2220510 [compost metagenome]